MRGKAAATLLLGSCILTSAFSILHSTLRSVASLPAHIAGAFEDFAACHVTPESDYLVFDRRARFVFTPGVPRELRRMLEEQVIPRLLARSGLQTTSHLKRVHSSGLGESHVDRLLTGVEMLGSANPS